MPSHKILFFGDSLTAGYGLKDVNNESFPSLIEQKIKSSGLPYHVVNAGISGDTSGGGLARIDYWLAQPTDVFILELGINDVIRGIPPSTTYKNLDSIIIKVKTKYPHCQLALMGMELPAIVPLNHANEFKMIFQKLAAHHQMVFVPFFLQGVAGIQHLNLRDGLHPSAKGYQVIADNVWPVLKPLLNR